MTTSGFTVLMESAAKANTLRWFGHVLRTEKDNSLRLALNFEIREEEEVVLEEHLKEKS